MQQVTNKAFYTIILCCTALVHITLHADRSKHRPKRTDLPSITAHYKNEKEIFTLTNSYLEAYPYFKIFDREYLEQFALPDTAITFRNEPLKSVDGTKLKKLINELITELQAHKKKFTHFTVLQDKDFNYERNWGLLILKFNDYPFVIKLFMETPESFINPSNKGIEQIFFFFMGGGINRHLTGFTRIKNRENVFEKIQKMPEWKDVIDIPRKMFWIPPSNKWMIIEGKNLGGVPIQKIEIPSTYILLADYIQSERPFSIYNSTDRATALTLCNQLDTAIDPHIQNFMIEKDSHKIIIVDTEHFRSLVGIRETKKFRTFTHWYTHLGNKFACDVYFKTKKQRKQAQHRNENLLAA